MALAVAWIAHAMRAGPAFPDGVAAYWTRVGLAVAAFAALVASLPLGFVRQLPRRCGALLRSPSPVVFAAIVAVVTTGLSIAFAFHAFERFPTTSDEFAQLWHAKMLVHGHLSLPADPNPEFFAIDNVIDAGRWYSQYPIGGALVLAPGVLLGVPWLVNPVLAGVAAAAMYHFARRAFGETDGRAIAALFAVTPMISMMAGSTMNHVPVLTLAACALASLIEWERAESPGRAMRSGALTGLLIGAMATIRPLDALAFAVVVGVFQVVIVRRDRTRAPQLAMQAVAGVIGVAPLLYTNWATNGHPLRFGYEVLWGAAHRVGFHTDPQGAAHTLGRGFEYATSYISQLNMFVLMWPVPALLVAIAALLCMTRMTRWDSLLLGVFCAQVVAYAAYWYQGQFLGPRFLFTALPALIVLIARAPSMVGARFPGFPARAALVATLACVAVSWGAVSLPFGVKGMADRVRESRRPLKVNLAAVVAGASLDRALVFLREPFTTRLLHRMWGVGVSRSDAAQLLARSDHCSLLTAIRAAEADTAASRAERVASIARNAAPYNGGPASLRLTDPSVRISSMAALTPECQSELVEDAQLGGAALGPALPLEPIGADGRIDGNVIFVADLGERNEVLRARFGDRTWYRLTIVQPDRSVRPTITPY